MNEETKKLTFIDLFSGCGGLSLGLISAGWRGVFAIEKNHDAFETLHTNLIQNKKAFHWPEWLPQKAMTTKDLLSKHKENLKKLKGKIDLIAGGPPCQGFSFAGRRNPNDPRNSLTEEYIRIVKLIEPKFLLIENVKGFTAPFHKNGTNRDEIYSEKVAGKLERSGYSVFKDILDASMFGVPQKRERFIMIAILEKHSCAISPFDIINATIPTFRASKGISNSEPITVRQAISDLELSGKELIPCSESKNFKQIRYEGKNLTPFQKLMRNNLEKTYSPNSLRIPKHKENTKNRFAEILKTCTPGKTIPKHRMQELGTKKNCLAPLDPDKPSRTITTLPDDLVHYCEPRILTVRENARIQSFPDWFVFKGKYTTGGKRRKLECPRYTQVGNAVPPLMSETLGIALSEIEENLCPKN